MVSPLLLKGMREAVYAAGGEPDRVPAEEYARISDEAMRVAIARDVAYQPRVSLVYLRCQEIARRYPKPKPYAKKKAVR